MNKTCALFLAALFALILSACHYEEGSIFIVSDSAKEENQNFETRSVSLINGTDDDVIATLFTRVYDKNEYVPYAGVRYWLQYVCDVTLEQTSYSDGEYTIVGYAMGKTFPIVVNTRDNTIYCSAWQGYHSPDPSFTVGNNKLLDSKKTYDGQRAVTFNLGKYGFKIYGGIDDAYAPVCVLNQLFASTLKNLQILYNGKNFYRYRQDFDYKSFKDSPWYADLSRRPSKLIEASYNTLCFTHDNLYGKPGYYGFADGGNGYANDEIVAAADELSFDEMLSKHDPETKALLLSPDYTNYLKGLARLTFYTYGDQHANIEWNGGIVFDNEEIKNAVKDIERNNASGKWKRDRKKSSIAQTNSLNWWRKEKGIVNDDGEIKPNKILELVDGGKTLIIRFDEFALDQSGGWDAYYATASAEPDPDSVAMPSDTIALFYTAFYYILHNPAYQNVTTVLIDESCNGGGAKPVMQYILYLLTGKGDLYYEDVHTGAKIHEIAKADLNLDGKVNSADEAYRARLFGTRSATCRGLNVAFLTSFNTFSCANATPFYARERGLKILGERSGGGSCVVGAGITADGFPYHFSVNSRLSAQDFSKTVEGGAEVDKPLLNGESYEWFYDYDNPSSSHLIAALKELFGAAY